MYRDSTNGYNYIIINENSQVEQTTNQIKAGDNEIPVNRQSHTPMFRNATVASQVPLNRITHILQQTA